MPTKEKDDPERRRQEKKEIPTTRTTSDRQANPQRGQSCFCFDLIWCWSSNLQIVAHHLPIVRCWVGENLVQWAQSGERLQSILGFTSADTRYSQAYLYSGCLGLTSQLNPSPSLFPSHLWSAQTVSSWICWRLLKNSRNLCVCVNRARPVGSLILALD